MSTKDFTEDDLIQEIKRLQLDMIERYSSLCNGMSELHKYGEFSSVPLWWMSKFDSSKRRRMAKKLEEKGILKSSRVSNGGNKYCLLKYHIVDLQNMLAKNV